MPEEAKRSEKPPFDIPELKTEPLAISITDSLSTSEAKAFSSGSEWELRSAQLDWWLRRRLKIALFIFVLVINIVWSYEVIKMLWSSGLNGTTFRLSDSVLIALVSTSIANFLGLVVIVARHLFPSDPSK
jgi:hypothetical protein